MRLVALIVVVLIWMIISSIPRTSVDKKTYSWLDPTPPQAVTHNEAKEPAQVKESTPIKEPAALAKKSKPSQSIDTFHLALQKEKARDRQAESPVKLVGQKVVCQKPGDSLRSLILSPKQNGCELFYVKSQSRERVARSLFSVKTCEQVRTKISKKLESSGFKCESES